MSQNTRTPELKTVVPSRNLEVPYEERRSNNFVRNGRVYILGDFDDTISRFVIPDFLDLIADAASQKDVAIPIYINSNGGEADKLQSLLSLMEIAHSQEIRIATYNIGNAFSCASLLAVSGDMRFMATGARNLMHLGEVGAVSKTYEQLKRNTKDVKDFFDETVRIYKEKTNMDEKEIREILKDDMYWMGAKECLKKGLCDVVI